MVNFRQESVVLMLKASRFFEIPLRAEDHIVKTGDIALTINGEELKTATIKNGEVG